MKGVWCVEHPFYPNVPEPFVKGMVGYDRLAVERYGMIKYVRSVLRD